MKAIFSTLFILMAAMVFAQSPLYTYIDGNGNKYEVYSSELKYIPVTPSNSSSGTYSGGDPKNVTLTSSQVDDLKILFEACITNKTEQTKQNTMGTATIKFKKVNKDLKVYMLASSYSKTKLENILVEIKGN